MGWFKVCLEDGSGSSSVTFGPDALGLLRVTGKAQGHHGVLVANYYQNIVFGLGGPEEPCLVTSLS